VRVIYLFIMKILLKVQR